MNRLFESDKKHDNTNMPSETKPKTYPTPQVFTWSKPMIDKYGKPVTLAELERLQELRRKTILAEEKTRGSERIFILE